MSETPKLRWDRGGSLGEFGTVTATVQDRSLARTDIYKFGAVDRTRRRIHREKDPERKEYGAGPENPENGGLLAGLVLSYKRHQRLVYQRPTTTGAELPPTVANALFDAGATKVEA